jgi:N-acetylmuramoyl-L-alanine amidase
VAHHRTPSTQEEATGAGILALRLIVIVSCISAVVATIQGAWEARSPVGTTPEVSASPVPPDVTPAALPANSSASLMAPAGQSPTPSPNPQSSTGQSTGVPRIGVVAGHWGSDQGATCPDGLAEVDINLDVAQRVVYILQALGYQADLLAEFDPRLESYRADALISIHADSCEDFPNATPPASGFKVASVEDSLVPEEEKRLVACMAQCYAARTGMYFHANSITHDMTRYHSFYEIDGQTPGAIIETGFMRKDRTMLTERPDLVAQGIVDGIVCFVGDPRP